jgi:predicted homoserine dehydrogenase-like protein
MVNAMVDTALGWREAQRAPVRVGLVGAGYAARAIALQLLTPIDGIRLTAIANRTIDKARRIVDDAGMREVRVATSRADIEGAARHDRTVITDDPMLLCNAAGLDVIVECTGQVEFGASVATTAIDYGKHVILVNAELDATLGPILKVRADQQGVVLSNTDGDEPGVAMNLYRFLKTVGLRPLAAGNIKGLLDPYRTPETQQDFARRAGQNARMVTSFADGTKLAQESTVLANATGFRVARRGMAGYRCAHVNDLAALLSPAELLQEGGRVDYVLGAREPSNGAFVLGYSDDPRRQDYLRAFKMGDGPLYCFYTPFHLPHVQIVPTIARAALLHDATVAPAGPPVCDAVAIAKRDLHAGEVLDGIGGFMCYGVVENADIASAEGLIPIGLAEGCRLIRAVAKDQALSYADVQVPPGRLADQLRADQTAYFSGQLSHAGERMN